MGHGEKLTSSYMCRTFLLAAAMYVDDTDLIHWGDSAHMEDEALIEKVQVATNDFGLLAQASGGALKPKKFFVYFMCYHMVNNKTKLKLLKKLPKPTATVKVKLKDGSEGLEPSHISLPQPDGSRAPIPTKEVSEATEML